MINFSKYCILRESEDFQLTTEKTKILSMLLRNVHSLGLYLGHILNALNNNNPQSLPPEQQTPEAEAAIKELFKMIKAASDSIPDDLIRDIPRLQRNTRPILDWSHKFLSKALLYKKQFNLKWNSLDQMYEYYLEIMK